MIKLSCYVLGPLDNNSFLLADDQSREAYIIDPSFDPKPILEAVKARELSVKAILLTHAHFDHIAGVGYLNALLPQPLDIALSSADVPLYTHSGNAMIYNFSIGELPSVTLRLFDRQILSLGSGQLEVRAVPGHTPGHVLFHVPSLGAILVGDLIFHRGVGRTDLAGGDFDSLVNSIRTQVFTLPPQTVLHPGHGPSTTVADEMAYNPFME